MISVMNPVKGLTRRWELPTDIRLDERPDRRVGERHGPTLFDRLLTARGLSDPADVRRFCDPRLTDLHEPTLLPDIDRAAARILDAVRSAERIAIYGDYDVDGITASAILFHTLRAIAPDAPLRPYVPHRMDEGYGLNEDALRALRSEGCTLAVSVDCGITAVAPARVARSIGLDLIITDHHHPPTDAADLPDAYAIVHPTRPGSSYPFPHLSGAGVAFKLAWRLCTMWCGSERVAKSLQQTLLEMFALTALGTIADVVPLIGENRVITRHGLARLRATGIDGLGALIRASKLDSDEIDAEKVGFQLAPRLNACGRLGHAAEALELLTTAHGAEADRIARRLTALNIERKQAQELIIEQAIEMAVASGQTAPGHRAIVLADPRWHPGIVGIACSRLAETFGRPTVLLCEADGVCRGSARSVTGYSLIDGLQACAETLISSGGHEAAAGLALRAESLDAFRAAFVDHAGRSLTEEDLVPTLRVDCGAWLAELDPTMIGRIDQLSPFGRANPRPRLLLRHATIVDSPRVLKERHLKLRLAQNLDGERREIEVLWWNAGSHAALLKAGRTIDAVIDPKINSFRGRSAVEAEVKDIALAPAH